MNERHKILIVDNERSHILMLNDILKPFYTTFAAKDGKTALNLAEKNMPALILLDVLMPDMTGFEVFAELKKNESTKKIPVIFITGLDAPDDEEKGLEMGAADYITKPFKPAIVKARVKTQLELLEYIRQIENFSLIDPLTLLHNRRSFDHRSDAEWSRALREQEPLSILMIDIDHFKRYNDVYGHPQGDECLKAIANIFTEVSKRRTDLINRWGGEEFAILLPDTDVSGALTLAESIRANIEGHTIPCKDGMPTSVTVSIGVNAVIPTHDDNIHDFIENADKALYRAKQTGRNRVCSYLDIYTANG